MGGYRASTLLGTDAGQARGFLDRENNALVWYNVPYAAPPTGALRWRAPQPHPPWQGELDATERRALDALTEDRLRMNIYRPNTDEGGLPIVLYAHGGGNTQGDSLMLEGANMVCGGRYIFISFDFRIGATGWLDLPALKTGDPLEDSGNYSLLDWLAMLNWVRRHAEALGGDADNITLSGTSHGARCTLLTLISPFFKGLYRRVFTLGGGMTTYDPRDFDTVVAEGLAKILVLQGRAASVDHGRAWLAEADPALVRQFMLDTPYEQLLLVYLTRPRNHIAPQMFRDGVTVPSDGFKAVARGEYIKVPVMMTSTVHDYLYTLVTEPDISAAIKDGSFFANPPLAQAFEAAKEYGSRLYRSFNVEHVAERMVAGGERPPIYACRFLYGSDPAVVGEHAARFLSATHADETKFWSGIFEGPQALHGDLMHKGVLGDLYQFDETTRPGRQALADTYRRYIANFVHTGDPETYRWAAERYMCNHMFRLDTK